MRPDLLAYVESADSQLKHQIEEVMDFVSPQADQAGMCRELIWEFALGLRNLAREEHLTAGKTRETLNRLTKALGKVGLELRALPEHTLSHIVRHSMSDEPTSIAPSEFLDIIGRARDRTGLLAEAIEVGPGQQRLSPVTFEAAKMAHSLLDNFSKRKASKTTDGPMATLCQMLAAIAGKDRNVNVERACEAAWRWHLGDDQAE